MEKTRFVITGVAAFASLFFGLVGCKGLPINDSSIGAAAKVLPAMTLTDEQVKENSRIGVAAMDAEARIASPGSKYQRRLDKLTRGLRSVEGQPLNYRVYMTEDINAFATADGSIRVYSGLMDLMDDDELTFVLGHEMGHVAEGHSAKRMRTALLASAGRELAASADGAVGLIASSEAGAFLEKVINAQFSQANERAADDFGLATLEKVRRDPNGAVTALEKLAALNSRGSSAVAQMTSTHPEPAARAERLRKRI